MTDPTVENPPDSKVRDAVKETEALSLGAAALTDWLVANEDHIHLAYKGGSTVFIDAATTDQFDALVAALPQPSSSDTTRAHGYFGGGCAVIIKFCPWLARERAA